MYEINISYNIVVYGIIWQLFWTPDTIIPSIATHCIHLNQSLHYSVLHSIASHSKYKLQKYQVRQKCHA